MSIRQRQKINLHIPPNYSIGKAILDILLDWAENTTLFESPYQQIKRLHREMRGIPAPLRWRYNRAIKYLVSLGQVKTITRNDKTFIKLTEKGKLRALLARLKHNYQKSKKWDGKWRLIIWDIPEASRRQRNQIRHFIKKVGFHQLQKSVFITPYPLPQEAVDYLRESELLGFIRFLRVDKIDDDSFLRNHFKL